MSVDPAAIAASTGAAGSAAVDALVTAELNALAADAQALQQMVSVGDTVTATVLPSNGLSDLLNILGNRVAASLPPTLVPGDVITAQVTGFNGNQILLQVLSASETPAPSTTTTPPGTTAPPPTTTSPPAASSAPPPPAGTVPAVPATPPPGSPGIAPPVSAFVAASVRPNAPTPLPIPPGTTLPDPPTGPDAPRGTIPGAPNTSLPPSTFDGIEARLAATRAVAWSPAVPNATPPAPPAAAAAAGVRLPPAPPPEGAAAAPPRPFSVPPPIGTSRFAEPVATATPTAVTATASPATAPAAPTAATYQDPLALVRALRLPVTPSTIAAAKLAIEAPQRLPTAIATLESALPQSDDPRITTLRTIAAFIGKIEPSSPQLATQIAAYVEHVVSGSEPAIAQLVSAHVAEDAAAPPTAPPPAAPAETVPGESVPPPAAAAVDVPPPALPVVALAQIAERAANIAASFKEQLFELVNGAAPAGLGTGADDLVPAARSVLAAVTSVQLATAQALAANPQTIAFSIPMWVGSGFAQAQLALDRDAPDSTPSAPLDGDNFHIAFILDTKNLGMVTVDLRTVGREFSLTVRTETLRTAQRFGDELSRLTDRLSSMRYTPKSVEAVVAGSAPAASGPLPSIVTDRSPTSNPKAPVNERA